MFNDIKLIHRREEEITVPVISFTHSLSFALSPSSFSVSWRPSAPPPFPSTARCYPPSFSLSIFLLLFCLFLLLPPHAFLPFALSFSVFLFVFYTSPLTPFSRLRARFFAISRLVPLLRPPYKRQAYDPSIRRHENLSHAACND